MEERLEKVALSDSQLKEEQKRRKSEHQTEAIESIALMAIAQTKISLEQSRNALVLLETAFEALLQIEGDTPRVKKMREDLAGMQFQPQLTSPAVGETRTRKYRQPLNKDDFLALCIYVPTETAASFRNLSRGNRQSQVETFMHFINAYESGKISLKAG